MHEAALNAGGHAHTFLLHNAKDVFLFTVPSGLNLTPLLQQAVLHKVIPLEVTVHKAAACDHFKIKQTPLCDYWSHSTSQKCTWVVRRSTKNVI